MNRSEVLDLVDPDWTERWRGDVDLAWTFYWQFAREDVERAMRELAA